MQTKDIKELKNQASLLGRYMRDVCGVELQHAQLLEALAAMHNAPDWNALQARPSEKKPKPASALSASELLAVAAEKGLTFGDAVNFFAERQTDAEKAYAAYARENLASEGDLEFDDPGCIVSKGDDSGAYVMAWKWVYDSDIPALKASKARSLQDIGDEALYLIAAYKDGIKVPAEDVDVKYVAGLGEHFLIVKDEADQTIFSVAQECWDEVEFEPYKLQPEDAAVAKELCLDEESVLVRLRYEGWELRVQVDL